MITIKPTDKSDVTKLFCPECHEKVRGVGLEKGSAILGLSFTCKRCKRLWTVTTE